MPFVILTPQQLGQSWQGYGIFILETLAALALIAVCAWAVVRFGGARIRGRMKTGRLKIVERLVLEPRRSVYLIEVDGKPLLIGASEGSVRLLKSLIPDEAADSPGEEEPTG